MATESFTNTSGTTLFAHSASWNIANALSTDFVIDGNELRTPFNRAIALAAFYSGTFANDQYAEATVSQVGSAGQFMGVCVRASNTNAYIFYCSPSVAALVKIVAGAYTELDVEFSFTLNAGDVIRLEVSGTSLVGKVNGATICTATDSSLASGNPGVSGNGGAASGSYTRIDDWVGNALAAASAAAALANYRKFLAR